MADNVSDGIKNLDKWIKSADQSLSTMMQRYERFQKAASSGDAMKMQQAWTSLQTGANSTATRFRTLEKEIRKLKASAKNDAELQRLDRLLRQLNSTSSAWASVLASVNRGQQTTQVFAERLARAFDKGQKSLAAFNNEQTKGAAASSRLNKGLADVLRGLTAYFGIHQIGSFLRNVVQVRGEFEKTEVALRNIIGNQEKSNLIWEKTMNLAVNSPFTAMQLTSYVKQLAAYRIENDKIFDTTKRLADVSAGLGVDMQRLILAYGQVKAANYLRASEIRQFTEAGVNILGELSDYLTITKGQMISTAQVMEMVQKRMVKFEDVEAIFNRMTDAGGTFYQMQQELSNTVQGQINKIKDTWQQSLNEIGKSDQGLIRGITDIVLSIVRNWRTWVTAIESSVVAIIAFKATNIVRALTSTAYAANAASKSTLRLANAFKALGKGIKANWIALAIAAALAAITELAMAAKRMKDFNDEIDEQSITLYDAQQKMYEYQKTVERNNGILKDAKSKEEDVKNAREENLKVLSALRKEYPELVEGIEQQSNGEVILTQRIEAHNESLREQIRLNEQLKQKSITDDPFETDTRQYFEKLDEWRKKIQISQQQLKLKLLRGEINKDENPIVERLLGINTDDILNAVNEYNQIVGEVQAVIVGKTTELNKAYREALNEAQKDLSDPDRAKKVQELQTRLMNLRHFAIESSNLGAVADLPLIDTDVQETREFKKESDVIVKELIGSFELGVRALDKEQKLIQETYNGNFAEYLKANGSRLREMVETNTVDVNETIRTFLEKNGQALTDENKKVWNDILNEYVFGADKARRIMDITFQLMSTTDPFVRNMLRQQMQAIKDEYYDFFASYTSPTKGDGLEDKNKTYKSIDSLISLLKTMNNEYGKLSKSAYGFAKSQETIMEVFKESFKDIMKATKGGGFALDKAFTMVDWSNLDITSKGGVAAALQQVYDYLDGNKMWGQFGKNAEEVRKKFEKEMASWKVEAGVELQVQMRDDFKKQMEQMFSDYELTVTLQGMDISAQAAKDWLNVDFTSLGDMQAAMSAFADKQIAKGTWDQDDAEAYLQWSKKIENQIYKERRDKAKEYSKYLEKELSERAKLEMEYTKKVAEVKGSKAFTEDQRTAILTNMKQEYENALRDLSWKSFKESDFYEEMMDDLTSIPAEYSQIMLDKLNEILAHPEDLSPRALKEAINARQKVMEARRQMDPLSAMKENRAGFRNFYQDESNRQEFGINAKTWKEAEKEIDGLIVKKTKELAQLEEEVTIYDQLIGEITTYNNKKKAAEESMVGIGGTIEDYTVEGLQEEIDNRQELLSPLLEEQNRYETLRDQKQQGATIDEEEYTNLLANLNVRQRNIAELRAEIELYQKAKDAKMEYERSDQGLSENARTLVGGGEITVGQTTGVTAQNIGTNRQSAVEKKDTTKSALQKMKQAKKMSKEWALAWHEFNAQLNSTIRSVASMGNAFYDTYEALGGETNALTRGWKEFGNTMVDVITNALTMIPTLVTGFTAAGKAIDAAMGIIGLIAEAIQLVLTLIGALAKLHDAGYEKQIEEQQKIIDDLKDAYERLEKAIEKTWTTMAYIDTYNQQVENIKQQIEAIEANRNAEDAKKNTDENKIKEYNKAIQEAYDELEELEQKRIEVFGGLGEVNYRSAAEEFVSAWKDAFLETGDGLDAFKEHFDEFLQEWFVKQATMRIAGAMLERTFRMIDESVNESSEGGVAVTMAELQAIRDEFAAQAPLISEALEELAGMWDLGNGEGSLSGLAAGIQGMTEEQANILEAYWNSVRMYTANLDGNVERIANILGAGGSATNPQLQQLQIIAQHTQAIHTLLDNVTRSGHPQGGLGIKVFNN